MREQRSSGRLAGIPVIEHEHMLGKSGDRGGSDMKTHHACTGANPVARDALRKFAMRGWIPRRSDILLLVAATLLFAPSVAVFAASDREDCAADPGNPDQNIASCSGVIADNTENAANRAHAY